MQELSEKEDQKRKERSERRKEQRERKRAEKEVRESRTFALSQALVNSAGTKIVDIAPSVALGVTGAMLLDTPRKVADMVTFPALPLAALKFELGPIKIGFDMSFLLDATADAVLRITNLQTRDDKFSLTDRVAIGAIITFAAQVSREVIRGFATGLGNMLVESIPA